MSAGNLPTAANDAAELVIADETEATAQSDSATPAISCRRVDSDPTNPDGPPLVGIIDVEGRLIRVVSDYDEDYEAELEHAKREERDARELVRNELVKSAYARGLLAEMGALNSARPAAPGTVDVVPAEAAVELVSARELEPEAIEWLWPGWLARGKLEILAGPPGTSKTTIALAIAAAITTGGKWPDGTAAPRGNVVMWTGEDGIADTLLPRFIALGGDRDRMKFVSGVSVAGSKRSFDPATDMQALSRAVTKLGDVSMIVVDSIASVIGTESNSHNNAETRRALQPVVDLANRHKALALGIAHYNKGSQGNDPIERVMGSIAFGALSRIVLGAVRMRDSKTERVLVRAKSNIGPDGDGFRYRLSVAEVPGYPEIGTVGSVTWGDALTGSPRELIKQAEADSAPSKLEQAVGLVETLLSEKGGKMPAAELKKEVLAAGVGENTFYSALKELKLQRKKDPGKGGRGEWIYELPPENLFTLFEPVQADANSDLTGGAA